MLRITIITSQSNSPERGLNKPWVVITSKQLVNISPSRDIVKSVEDYSYLILGKDSQQGYIIGFLPE